MTACLTHGDGYARRDDGCARLEEDEARGEERRLSLHTGDGRDTKSVAARRLSNLRAQLFLVLRGRRLTTAWKPHYPFCCGTPPRELLRCDSLDKTDSKLLVEHRTGRLNSPPTASFLRRGVEICQNIIGRSVSVVPILPGRFGRRVLFFGGSGAFLVLNQPARQHGRGVLFDPGLQQLSDFLSQIGGVAQPRELIALQGITRSRQKKVPRRLGTVVGQRVLQAIGGDSNTLVHIVNGTRTVINCGKLWKFDWSEMRPITSEVRVVKA